MIRGGILLYMFPRTYHEGTILTIYMSLWHRAIYFIELLHRYLAEYLDDTWIEGIHILGLSYGENLIGPK